MQNRVNNSFSINSVRNLQYLAGSVALTTINILNQRYIRVFHPYCAFPGPSRNIGELAFKK